MSLSNPQAARAASNDDRPADSGIEALCLLATILGERLDPAQLRHEYLQPGRPASADDLLRIARRAR
jgi:hypothetical protein